MFGVSRKRSKPGKIRAASAASSSDDEDDEVARSRLREHQRRKKKSKAEKKRKTKKATAPMLSFDPDDGGGDSGSNKTSSSKSKKRKKHSGRHKSKRRDEGGLGYGGLGAMPANASDESSSDLEKDGGEGGSFGRSYYDAAALEKLRSEQKRNTLAKDDTVHPETKAVNDQSKEMAKESTEVVDENEEGESVPRSGGKTNFESSSSPHAADPVVLTGDEAMAYAHEQDEEEEFISLTGAGACRKASSSRQADDPVVLAGDEAMAYDRHGGGEKDAEFDHGLYSPPTPPLAGIVGDKVTEKKTAGIVIDADNMEIDEQSEEVEEGNRQWEDGMARRAGVLPLDAAATGDELGSRRRRRQGGESSSLPEIKASLRATVSNLDGRRSDLEGNARRHQSTLSSLRDELSGHRQTLERHGEALEYYQGLREDLATWMGALREMNGMVEEAEGARRRLEWETSRRRLEAFWEWGRDCTEVLEKRGLVKDNLGGQIALCDMNNNVEVAAQVDEFGRDLSSMASIARVKRWNQRRKRCLERSQGAVDVVDGDIHDSLRRRVECSNEDNIGRDEVTEWERKHEALARAIGIIPKLVKDDYLSISSMCSLFFEWKRRYVEDYANCYAEISLAQMASVLVRLELCDRWDVLGLRSHSSGAPCVEISEFDWVRDLDKKADSCNRILLEVIQKQVVGPLVDSFEFEYSSRRSKKQRCIYDPFSATQTKHLCSMLKSVQHFFSTHFGGNRKDIREETRAKVSASLLSSMKFCIQKMTIPIVDTSKVTITQNDFEPTDHSKLFDGETADAIAYATVIQAKELCKLVKNILEHWYPLVNPESGRRHEDISALVQFLFSDIISGRILPILHSFQDITFGGTDCDVKYSEVPKTLINGLLDSAKAVGLLDEDEWMLVAAPLRVAASQWNHGPN